MNKPYVKEYNDQGVVTNPIKGSFLTPSINGNRRDRRSVKQADRFRGNNKGHNLSVGPSYKYSRRIQCVLLSDGSIKKIKHYDLKRYV